MVKPLGAFFCDLTRTRDKTHLKLLQHVGASFCGPSKYVFMLRLQARLLWKKTKSKFPSRTGLRLPITNFPRIVAALLGFRPVEQDV